MGARPPGRPATPAAVAFALALVAAGAGCRGGCGRTRIPARGDGGAVVVVAPVAGGDLGGVAATQEVEPNNTARAAQVLTLAADPLAAAAIGTVPGIGKTADVDVFKLVIPDPAAALVDGGGGAPAAADADPAGAPPPTARRMMIELQPDPGLSPILQLLDAGGRSLVTSSAATGERDGIPNIAVLPGSVYLVRVRGLERPVPPRPGTVVADAGPASARVGYRLVVRVMDFELGDEREPNDGAGAATLLEDAQRSPEVAGYLGWRRDEDWYRLPVDGVPAGTVLDVELDGLEEVTTSLAVHDAAGARLAGARGARRGERLALRNVAVPAVAVAPPVGVDGGGAGGRALYLVVRAEGGRNLDRRYSLRVRPDVAKEGMELEPNDVAARASPMAEGVTSGFLPVGDVDLFRYNPPAPGAVDLEVTPAARVNVKLEVLRAADNQPLASADAAGRGQVERLTGVPASEAILVRVSPRPGEGNAEEPYQLRLTARAATAPPPPAPGAGGAPP
jgi:hypothetical protein